MSLNRRLGHVCAVLCAAVMILFIGAPVALRPANPKHVTATSVSSNAINLTWTHSGKRITGFSVARRQATPGYAFQTIASVSGSDRSFLDETAQPSTKYLYSITALGKMGNSKRVQSKPVTTPEATSPQPPSEQPAIPGYDEPEITDPLPAPEEPVKDETARLWSSADTSAGMRAASTAPGNLVSNPGFETNPYTSFSYQGYPGLEWGGPARTGSYALVMNFSNNNYPSHGGTAFKPTWKTLDKIPVSPGSKYAVSAYVYANELQNGFSIVTYYRSDSGKLTSTTKFASLSPSDPIISAEQWKKLSVTLDAAPSTAKYIAVEFQLIGGGAVAIDDLAIMNATAGTPLTLNNASFETSPYANYLPTDWSGGGFSWSASGRTGRSLAINFAGANFPMLATTQMPLKWLTKVPATSGVSYSASIWSYVTEGSSVGLTAFYRLMDGKLAGATTAPQTVTAFDTWTQLSLTLPPAPSNVKQIELQLGSLGATMSWFDDLEVRSMSGGSACPTKIRIESTDQSDLDGGWTGNSHDTKLGAGINTVMNVSSCQGASSPGCGECLITGPIVDPSGPNTLRCLKDSSVICSTNAECETAGLGTCEYFAGGPLPAVSGGVAGCVVSRWIGTLNGTANLDTGRLHMPNFDMKSTIHTNGTVESPCPVCQGDPTFRDGVRGGTCVGGGRNGLSCDVQTVHPWFDNGTTNGESLDCPPAVGDVSGVGTLDMKLGPFSTDPLSWELTSTSPNCRGQSAYKCFCDTCNNLEATPCHSNADCPMSGGQPGICGGKRCLNGTRNGLPCTITSDPVMGCPGGACSRPGMATQPNGCIGEIDGEVVDRCILRPDGDGQCANGPTVTHCDGKPWIGCVNDSECVLQGAGTSCMPAAQLCYVDNGTLNPLVKVSTDSYATPFDANGVANVKIGTLFCFGITGAAAVNTAVGFPGLGRIEQNVKVTAIP